MMITIKEAVQLTGLSYYAIRNLCLRGDVYCIKSGVKYFINRHSLLSYLGAADDGRD